MTLLQLLDSFYNFNPVKSDFDLAIVLKVLICNKIYHGSIKSQVYKILSVLGQPQNFFKPKHCVLCTPVLVILSVKHLLYFGYLWLWIVLRI